MKIQVNMPDIANTMPLQNGATEENVELLFANFFKSKEPALDNQFKENTAEKQIKSLSIDSPLAYNRNDTYPPFMMQQIDLDDFLKKDINNLSIENKLPFTILDSEQLEENAKSMRVDDGADASNPNLMVAISLNQNTYSLPTATTQSNKDVSRYDSVVNQIEHANSFERAEIMPGAASTIKTMTQPAMDESATNRAIDVDEFKFDMGDFSRHNNSIRLINPEKPNATQFKIADFTQKLSPPEATLSNSTMSLNEAFDLGSVSSNTTLESIFSTELETTLNADLVAKTELLQKPEALTKTEIVPQPDAIPKSVTMPTLDQMIKTEVLIEDKQIPKSGNNEIPNMIEEKLVEPSLEKNNLNSGFPNRIINEPATEDNPVESIKGEMTLAKDVMGLVDNKIKMPDLKTIPSVLPISDITLNVSDKVAAIKPLPNDDEKIAVQAALEAADTGSTAQQIKFFDAILSNVADFFNKRLTTTDSLSTKAGVTAPLTGSEIYGSTDKKSALEAFRFSSNGMDTSLKVENYTAKIKVYPPDLGQITAEILVNKGMTQLTLTTENAHVKHFIETNLQQLRESFQNSNINLGQVSVQNNDMQNKNEFQQKQNSFDDLTGLEEIENKDSQLVSTKKAPSNSIIDTYA